MDLNVDIQWMIFQIKTDLNTYFKKLMIDFYSVFAEKYKLNPTDGWKDAFEETFGLSLEDFYSDFDAFMRLDKESQVAIIKSTDEWINSSWN